VCQMTTGMGLANAAASLTAVMYSGEFDFRNAYVIIAGIAGIDPAEGTIGTAAWARYAVDVGIAHEIDARELPKGWNEGYFGVMTDSPDAVPKLAYRSEVFRLDEALLQRAYTLSKKAALEDAEDVRVYRQHYPSAPANQPPAVTICDTASSDTWWVGRRLGDHARHFTKLLTQGAGAYCTTQQEDNASLTVLTRASKSGLLDLRRVAILRSGSDFDRPYPQQGVLDGLRAQLQIQNTVRIATRNLVLAGMPLVNDIVHHWDQWKNGVPTTPAP
jgi:purine nucleoside permease